jgi:aspartate aminotransferase
MIRKMFEIVEGKDFINLSIGEPDFDTHEFVVEKACRAMREGFTHYTSNFGIEELRAAIAERYAERGVSIDGKNVMISAGASEALLNASLAFIEEGSRVIIPSPNFLSYFTYAKLCKARIEQISTHENNFEVDVNALNEVMGRDVSLIFLNYPNNPTGVVMNKKSLKAIAEIAEDYKAIVVSDEVYDSIYYDKKPATLAGHENAIIINAFSKSLAMTGWRIGYAIASKELLDSMLKVHQVNGVCAPAFAQKAVANVMQEEKDRKITAGMVEEFRKRRDFVYSSLKKIGLRVVKPEGAFYIFPQVPINCMEFVERLMDGGVAVTPGLPFGDWNEHHIRISYAASMENLRGAMERMDKIVASLI